MGIFVSAFLFALAKYRVPAGIFAVWGGIALVLFYANHTDETFINENRFITAELKTSIEETKGIMYDMEEYLDTEITGNPWDYTIATYIVSPIQYRYLFRTDML